MISFRYYHLLDQRWYGLRQEKMTGSVANPLGFCHSTSLITDILVTAFYLTQFRQRKKTHILFKNLNLCLQYKPNALCNTCLHSVMFVLRSPTGSLLVTLYQALILSAAKTRRLFTGSILVVNSTNRNNEPLRKNIQGSWGL